MTEQLIADIRDQLSEHMQALSAAVDQVQSQIGEGEVPEESLEVAVQQSAAAVIAAVGALRALAEAEDAERFED